MREVNGWLIGEKMPPKQEGRIDIGVGVMPPLTFVITGG